MLNKELRTCSSCAKVISDCYYFYRNLNMTNSLQFSVLPILHIYIGLVEHPIRSPVIDRHYALKQADDISCMDL
jgi:hypothetical protein